MHPTPGHRFLSPASAAVVLALAAAPAAGQETAEAVRDDMIAHFERSSRKVLSLSEAMPADLFDWSPSEGVMSVGHVYAHIARYNFMYLQDNLGIPAPDGVVVDRIEDLRDKDTVRAILTQSVEHVRHALRDMTREQLTRETTLYGRRVPGWMVLTQLVAHMNEHVGQSVAYARMNDIVPPWSR